jgi:hypothetical protein
MGDERGRHTTRVLAGRERQGGGGAGEQDRGMLIRGGRYTKQGVERCEGSKSERKRAGRRRERWARQRLKHLFVSLHNGFQGGKFVLQPD